MSWFGQDRGEGRSTARRGIVRNLMSSGYKVTSSSRLGWAGESGAASVAASAPRGVLGVRGDAVFRRLGVTGETGESGRLDVLGVAGVVGDAGALSSSTDAVRCRSGTR